MKASARLRQLLTEDSILVAPGAYDALSARLAERAGFDVVYMTGAGTTASLLGQADVGVTTLTEMVTHAANLAAAIDIPLLSDCDTGYGNFFNVMRAIRAFERAGVAGVHIEDQEFPKRCGHVEGKRVIPAQEMVGKIKAAVDSRLDDDFVIIARTDARAVDGFEAALERAALYREAGADLTFVESPYSVQEMERICRELPWPQMANMVEGGKTPLLPAKNLEAIGFRLVVFPITALVASFRAVQAALTRLRGQGSSDWLLEEGDPFEEWKEVVGFPQVYELERTYLG